MKKIFYLVSIALGSLLLTGATSTQRITPVAPLQLSSGQLSIPQADTDTDGYLSSEDWNTFNSGGSTAWGSITGTLSDQTDLQSALDGKEDTLTTGNLTSADTQISVSGGTGAVIGAGAQLTCATAGAGQSGCLSSSDWTTFNNKGSGDVVGPASSVDSEIALFNSTTGKLLKAATGTGVCKVTSGVFSTSNVNLGSEVTSTLPIANGGTGQTTQTNAFDALSPTTTLGDFIVSNGSDNVRLPVCTDGQVFIGDSGDAEGWSCGLPQSDLSNVTNTLAIGNGGTGQTTQTAAFDALSPTTTKGDLIISDGSDNVRFAVCSDGEILVADSGETTGWNCGSASGDVSGPASSVDNSIVTFNGTGGKTIQENDGACAITGSATNPTLQCATTGGGTFNITGQSSASAAVDGSAITIKSGSYTGASTRFPGTVRLHGGDSNGSGLSALVWVKAGDNSHATGQGGNLWLDGGSATAGSGDGGDILLREGTSSTGADGHVEIGRSGSSSVHVINGATVATASDTLTMTNAPGSTAGDPAVYLKININGTDYIMPAWTAP